MDANFPLTPGRNSSEEKAHLSTNYSHQTMDGNISSPASPGQKSSEDKPRLSEKQKKANHIASEQKRRQAIREGFDRLTELVPGLEGQGRSESVVLKKTVDFMRDQVEERKRLIARIEELGGEVDDSKRI